MPRLVTLAAGAAAWARRRYLPARPRVSHTRGLPLNLERSADLSSGAFFFV